MATDEIKFTYYHIVQGQVNQTISLSFFKWMHISISACVFKCNTSNLFQILYEFQLQHEVLIYFDCIHQVIFQATTIFKTFMFL